MEGCLIICNVGCYHPPPLCDWFIHIMHSYDNYEWLLYVIQPCCEIHIEFARWDTCHRREKGNHDYHSWDDGSSWECFLRCNNYFIALWYGMMMVVVVVEDDYRGMLLYLALLVITITYLREKVLSINTPWPCQNH